MSIQSSVAEKLGVELWERRLFLNSSLMDSLTFQIPGLLVGLRHQLVPSSPAGEVIKFPRFVSLSLG